MKNIKKTRYKKLNIEIDSNIKQINKILVDEDEIRIFADQSDTNSIKNLGLETYYIKNNSKKKILNRTSNISLDLSENDVFSNYNIVCASDTNTRKYNDYSFSSSAFLIGMKDFSEENKTQYSFILYVIGWESTGVEKPENYAWAVLISKVKERETIEKGEPSVILVVDSDLGNHDLFNKQEKPLIDDFYLPDNFTISYASADSGSEYPPNVLIRFCDKEANKAMKEWFKEFVIENDEYIS